MFWSVVSEAYVGPYICNRAFLRPSYMFDRVWNTPKNFPNFLFNFLGFSGQYSCLIGLFLLKSFKSLVFNKSFLTRSFFTNKNTLQKECLKIFCNSFRQSLLFINENSKLFSWLEKVINTSFVNRSDFVAHSIGKLPKCFKYWGFKFWCILEGTYNFCKIFTITFGVYTVENPVD